MPIWTRDICGSSFSFDEWGVNVTSLVKPDKYAALSDGEHWTQVADFECAGIAGLCGFIKENYTTSEEPLGEDILQAFGINGTITYNNDLTVTVALPDYTQEQLDAIRAWSDAGLGQGKVAIGG